MQDVGDGAVKKIPVLLCAMTCLTMALTAGACLAAVEEASDELVEMVVGLLNDKDRDMRALGLQQVRTEAKGQAATKRFAAVLPKLPPEAQVGLLTALGERGDPAARSAVIEMLDSQEESVRAAAIGALGALGGLSDVSVLVRKLTASTESEKAAAQQALARLRGQGVNAAIAAELKQAKPDACAKLLKALAARNATDSVAAILQAAEAPELEVRLAALAALRGLADQSHTGAIVRLLKAARQDDEQNQAEAALSAVCARGREACVDAIRAGMPGAAPWARAALLRTLARAGGPRSLEAVVAATKDDDSMVRDEAVRLLAGWPEASVAPHLLAIAGQSGPLRYHVLAVRGLVRLASPLADRPANLDLLAESLKIAKRPEEKRIVLGVLGSIPTAQSLALIVPAMDDPDLADEACLAALLIAESQTNLDKGQRRAVAEKALAKAKSQPIRERAGKLIKSR